MTRGLPLAAALGGLLVAHPVSALTGPSGAVDAWYGLALVQESPGDRDAAITIFKDVVSGLRDRLLVPADVVIPPNGIPRAEFFTRSDSGAGRPAPESPRDSPAA